MLLNATSPEYVLALRIRMLALYTDRVFGLVRREKGGVERYIGGKVGI